MSVEATGARRRTETVGVPGELPFVVIVRDDAGQPVPDTSVTFSSLPSGSIEFPGGQPSVSVRTNAQGEAPTDYTPRSRGQQMVIAATDSHGKTTFTLDVYEPESPVQVRHMDDGTRLVVARIPEPAPPPVVIPAQKHYALAILGLCFMAGLVALFALDEMRTPIQVDRMVPVVTERVVPPVDNQARTAIAAERTRNDAQDARLIEEDRINWAIGGNAQRALSNDDRLQRNFERFYRGGSTRGASGSSSDVCSGPHWALYAKCRP